MSASVILGTPVHTPSAEYQYPKTLLSVPEHPHSAELIALWRAFEAKDGMRMGRDIPSRALSKLLPSLVIAEPVDAWRDARIRLAGSVLAERFGRDISGLLISELYKAAPSDGEMLVSAGRRAVESHDPVLIDARVLAGTTEIMRFEVAALPILAPDGVGQWCLVGTFRF